MQSHYYFSTCRILHLILCHPEASGLRGPEEARRGCPILARFLRKGGNYGRLQRSPLTLMFPSTQTELGKGQVGKAGRVRSGGGCVPYKVQFTPVKSTLVAFDPLESRHFFHSLNH